MTYLLKSSKPDHRGRKLFVGGLMFTGLILLFTYNVGARATAASFLQSIGVPIWKVQDYVYHSETGLFAYIRSKTSLANENRVLREQNQILQAENLKMTILQDENESLKASLGRTTKDERVLASVLVHPSKSLYDTLTIDAGKKEGIVPGDFVSVNDVYLGKVSEVFAHSARVVLFSSGGQKTDVLLNPSHVSVVAYGRGGGNFEAQVPRGIDLAKGDVITLPGISVDIFATVADIIEKPTDSFKTILFKNPVNVETLKWVEVVKQ